MCAKKCYIYYAVQLMLCSSCDGAYTIQPVQWTRCFSMHAMQMMLGGLTLMNRHAHTKRLLKRHMHTHTDIDALMHTHASVDDDDDGGR